LASEQSRVKGGHIYIIISDIYICKSSQYQSKSTPLLKAKWLKIKMKSPPFLMRYRYVLKHSRNGRKKISFSTTALTVHNFPQKWVFSIFHSIIIIRDRIQIPIPNESHVKVQFGAISQLQKILTLSEKDTLQSKIKIVVFCKNNKQPSPNSCLTVFFEIFTNYRDR
jgi:hypothetical protein